MNLLFLIRSLDCGGAERQLALLANGLSDRGHQITLATFYGGGVRERDLSPGVRLRCLGKRSRWDIAGTVSRLRKLVREIKPDVVHGYLTAGNLAATMTLLTDVHLKVIWALRDSNMDMRRYGGVTRIASRLASLLAFTADGIIANSRAGVEHAVRSGYPSGRIVHVPNGIDVSRFYPDAEAGKAFRRNLGVAEGQPLIGLVGRLDPMKDHPSFLVAAGELKKDMPDAQFLCAGDGPAGYRTALLELAGKLGLQQSVHWISSCTEMRALYSALDVFCLSSVYGEGFPNVLGEAMACGRPCVTTDVGDAALISGSAATVVSRGNPQQLAAAIKANLTEKSRPAARERILTEFSVERMIDATERLLLSWSAGRSAIRSSAHYA